MNLIRFLILPLLFVTALWSEAATIQIDKDTVTPGEGVTVTLTAQGSKITFPTLKKIGDYPIDPPKISQEFSATIQNGTTTTLQQKSMRFTFYPDRNVTIPAMKIVVDGTTYQTRPTPIRVVPASSLPSGQRYRLTMRLDRKKVYVGEPFVLQVIFYEPRNSDIAQAQYIPPTFDGFFVKSTPQERLENTPEGTRHVFDYILTPQKEGNFTIPAPMIKLGIQTLNAAQDPWGLFGNDIRWQSLRGTPKQIEVLPLPADVDLIGRFTIDAQARPLQVAANKPVSYTLTITGEGGLEELEDPTFDLPDVTVYSDEAKVDTRIQGGRIISHWSKKYSFIADHDFTTPAVTLTQFDPRSGTTKTLSTRPFSVHVTGSAKAATPPAASTPAASTSAPQKAAAGAPATSHKKEDNASLFDDTAFYQRLAEQNRAHLFSFVWLIGAFLLGVVVTLLATRLLRRFTAGRAAKIRRHYTPDEALEILYPHTNDSPEIERTVRDLYRVKRGEKVSIDSKKLAELIERTRN